MSEARSMRRSGAVIAVLAACVALTGCSVRSMAVRSLGNALAGSGDTFSSDEDPELVGDALPFALKTMEALLAEEPEHRGLLLATCSGFTQYGYGWVETRAFELEESDFRAARRDRERALKLYLRARDYCLRAMELESPGVTVGLRGSPETALAEFGSSDVELVYWTAASWGAAIAAGLDRPELTADLPAVRALAERALDLDESWSGGMIHDMMIALEAASELSGGTAEQATVHLERAVELSGGNRAAPWVAHARGVRIPAQDRAGFEADLEAALAIDPDAVPKWRLPNLIAQRRARLLLDRAEEWFLE